MVNFQSDGFKGDHEENRATRDTTATRRGVNRLPVRRPERPSLLPQKRGDDQNLLVLTDDVQFQENIDMLEKNREILKETNEQLERFLNLDKESAEQAPSFFLSLVPTLFRRFLPGVWQVESEHGIKERPPILEELDRQMREGINNVQDVMQRLAAAAMTKFDECAHLEASVAQAKKDEWNARELQEFIAAESGIDIRQEIRDLLDEKFDYLPEKEKRRIRKELLQRLAETSKTGKELMGLLKDVCVAGLEVLEQQIVQYYQYKLAVEPIINIQKAAHEFTEGDASVYKSRVALATVATRSIVAIRVAMRVAKLARQFAIASPEMDAILRDGRLQIEEEAKLFLEESREPIDVDAESETSAAPKTPGNDGEAQEPRRGTSHTGG